MPTDPTKLSHIRRYLSISYFVTPHGLLTNETNKFVTFLILIIFELLLQALWFIAMYIISETGSFFGLLLNASDAIAQKAILIMGIICFWMLIISSVSIIIIRYLEKRTWAWYVYQGIYLSIYLLYCIILATFMGHNTAIMGITWLSGMIAGLLLIDKRFVPAAFVLCMTSFSFFMLNNEYQWLKHLPTFYPYHHANEELVWSWSYIYLSVTKTALALYVVTMMLRLLKQQQNEIREVSEKDPLTNVYNRRNMHYFFNYLWQYPQKWHMLSLVYLDIDKFKYINDSYGHDVGDDTLLLVVSAIHDVIDGQFYLCRHGGEEFLIIMRNVSVEEATQLAEQIRLRISEKQFIRIRQNDQPITASFGVAGIQQANDSIFANKPDINYETFVECIDKKDKLPLLPEAVSTLLMTVDHAMQTAKRQGRNRVFTVPVMPLDSQFNLIKL